MRNRYSHFDEAPHVEVQRSKWPMPQTVKTSFNVSELVPTYVSEILPGDTWSVSTSKLVRMQTLKTPLMDDLYLDTYFFFVPNRLVWSHWKEFMGESPKAWLPQVEYTVPQLTAPSGGWSVGSVADYLGIPPLVDNISVNALPFRCYAKIIEDWFRDTNLQDAQVIYDGDSDVAGLNPGDGTYLTEPARGGASFKAAKLHDYFTSALPEPQRGDSVTVNLAQGALPVYTIGTANDYYWRDGDISTDYSNRVLKESYPLQWDNGNGPYTGALTDPDFMPNPYIQFYKVSAAADSYAGKGHGAYPAASDILYQKDDTNAVVSDKSLTYNNKTLFDLHFQDSNSVQWRPMTPTNLVAGVSGYSSLISINELRKAFQVQRFYEASARGGNRYISLLKAMFGVTSPDARLQRSEYLGGNRIRLNVRQIIQTSETTSNSPLGDLAGVSVTGDKNYDFTKSFTEHGYIIGLSVVRYNHTYQQGIEPMFMRKTLFDFYFPALAHLGEQPVLNQNIYATGTSTDTEVFGYQEAWADYRYKPNRVSGMMRSVANTGLDTWHFADYYTQQPYLSGTWIQEDASNVDRCLTVSSNTSDQLFMDMLVDAYVTRPMPLYSVPGLIDHM